MIFLNQKNAKTASIGNSLEKEVSITVSILILINGQEKESKKMIVADYGRKEDEITHIR